MYFESREKVARLETAVKPHFVFLVLSLVNQWLFVQYLLLQQLEIDECLYQYYAHAYLCSASTVAGRRRCLRKRSCFQLYSSRSCLDDDRHSLQIDSEIRKQIRARRSFLHPVLTVNFQPWCKIRCYFEDRFEVLPRYDFVLDELDAQYGFFLLADRLVVDRIGWQQLFNIDVIVRLDLRHCLLFLVHEVI